MIEHTNTHAITAECMRCEEYVLGTVDGRRMVGVTFAPGGWRPARIAREADLEYFGAAAQPANTEEKS